LDYAGVEVEKRSPGLPLLHRITSEMIWFRSTQNRC